MTQAEAEAFEHSIAAEAINDANSLSEQTSASVFRGGGGGAGGEGSHMESAVGSRGGFRAVGGNSNLVPNSEVKKA